MIQMNIVINLTDEWKKELKYTNFFVFWFKSNALMKNDQIQNLVFKYIYPVIFFWAVELVIIYNIPLAIIGLRKWFKGQYDGQEKLTDLVRATVIVKKADEIIEVMKLIDSHPSFRLVRLKNRLKKL